MPFALSLSLSFSLNGACLLCRRPLVGRGVLFPRLPPDLRAQTLAMRADGLWAHEEGVDAATYAESDIRCETIVASLSGNEGRAIGHVQYDFATKRLRQLFVMPQVRLSTSSKHSTYSRITSFSSLSHLLTVCTIRD